MSIILEKNILRKLVAVILENKVSHQQMSSNQEGIQISEIFNGIFDLFQSSPRQERRERKQSEEVYAR